MKSKILLVGCGWRSKIYRRAVENLSDEFELCGIITQSEQRAEEVTKETGICATSSFDKALSWKPDFAILCVPRVVAKEWLFRFMENQIPVLCETPPGRTVDELNEIWKENVRLNGKVQVAEQYFLQPYYHAVQTIIESGILGEILSANMSAIHGYHAMSIFRKFLGLGFENCTITGKRYEFPITKTRDRAGWHESGEVIRTTRDRADMVFENGKIAFFDFDDEHYFSPIRSRRWNVQGMRGEIQNDTVCYLNENNKPIVEKMHREDDGVNNIDGWSHMYIGFRGERIYENPFPGLRINDDEIAVTDLLVGMKKYVETGEDIYSLRDGLQDAYLDFMREEAMISGETIHTTSQSWVDFEKKKSNNTVNLDFLKGLFRESSIERLRNIFDTANNIESENVLENLQFDLMNVLQREKSNGLYMWEISPSGKNHIAVVEDMCLLFNVFGVKVLFTDGLYFDGELRNTNFHWIEKDNLVLFDVHYIVRDTWEKCICHYAYNDFGVYFSNIK